MSWLEAIILGLVEGITEFLPISSTGHLILTRDLLGLEGDAVDRQLIIIQGAAILAVVWEFRQKLFSTAFSLHSSAVSRRFLLNLFIVSIPLGVLGLLFEDQIKAVLFNPITVAIALVVGGVIILWAEKRPHSERITDVDQLTWRDAASRCRLKAVCSSFCRNSQHTARMAGPWMKMTSASTAGPCSPSRDCVRIRCPVLEIGRNSVMPSTRPRMIASSQDIGVSRNSGRAV